MDYMAPWNDEDLNGDGGIGAELGPGDLANLLVKLTDNALSGATFERRAAARGVLEAFKQSCFAEEDTMNVIAVIEQLVNDQEQLVRQEIMDQLPEVAMFCHEEGPYLDFVVPQHILPHIVKLITDKFSQVRKAAQTGLLSLLEKGIIAPRQVAEQVCPVIMEYTEPTVMDDYRTEVTGFMSKLARLVGKEIVVNWFLERFCALCQDPMFQVRRVCASSMGEISAVIGTRLTEAVLLPEFLVLCKDDVWGVRKGCAEVFTDIARLCQLPTRRDKLTPVFIKLLEDTTRWVKVAAYQSLGSFIATFSVEMDSPVEVPELTEMEKTFIERVKEFPSLLSGDGQLLKGHRTSMLGSASTEDLTSICILDDNEEEEESNGEEKGAREEDQEEKKKEGEGEGKREAPVGSEGTYDFGTSDVKLYSVDDGDGGGGGTGDQGMDTNLQQYSSSNNNNNCEDNADSVVSSSSDSGSSSVSPQITVTESEDARGVRIHLEKEANTDLAFSLRNGALVGQSQNCRVRSRVLSHRPVGSFCGYNPSNHVANTTNNSNVTEVSANCSDSQCADATPAPSPSENTPTFNTFQYWRIPLPDIELDIGLIEGKPASVHVRAKVEDPQMNLTYQSEISVNLSSELEEAGNGKSLENYQIQALSSSSISDNDADVTTKLESSLSNTTVSLVDGRMAEVHKSYMDLYNVSAAAVGMSATNNNNTQDKDGAAANNIGQQHQQQSGIGNRSYDYVTGLEDISLDMTHLDAFDDDSDDQLNTCSYPFGDEPAKKTRLLPELPKSSIQIKQDVVPDVLLDHFINMSQDGDPELAPCCVFNLPAVVLTLGPQHWSSLRECYENLAGSLQWKVRYTLAACLHEIANILGPELSERDLIPFYNALMKDLDEVRIGLLKHLAGFFKILGGEERKKCLKSVQGFIKTDNPRNWRFRLELVYQIQQLVDMFEMDDVFRHICPVCIDLIKDNVAEIRKESLNAVAYVVKRLNECHATALTSGYSGGSGDPSNPVHEFLVDLVKALSESSKWVRRQTFAALSGQLLATHALYPNQFAQDILPHLIGLSEDKVPNVRLVVARSIVSHVLQNDCFSDPLDPHSISVMETLMKLQDDVDQDVRYHSRKPGEEDHDQTLELEEEDNSLLEKVVAAGRIVAEERAVEAVENNHHNMLLLAEK